MINQWSYSRLSCFEKCPKQAEFKFVKKLKEPGSPAMDRGKHIHKLCEEYIRGFHQEIPEEIKGLEDNFKELKELHERGHVLCEEDWAWDEEWKRTGWFDYNTWGRAKVDAFVYEEGISEQARVIDFKTGKFEGNEEAHREQCELYGSIALKRFPELEEIITEMWYLDHNKISKFVYDTQTIILKRDRINARAIDMTTATEFPANPHKWKCRWCHFGKEGLCEERITD